MMSNEVTSMLVKHQTIFQISSLVNSVEKISSAQVTSSIGSLQPEIFVLKVNHGN